MKVLLVVLAIAIATYVVIRLLQERGVSVGIPTSRPAAPRRRPTRPARPVAPDDDEDFLRELDRKRLDPPAE